MISCTARTDSATGPFLVRSCLNGGRSFRPNHIPNTLKGCPIAAVTSVKTTRAV